MARSDPVIETFGDLTSRYAFDDPRWTYEILRVLARSDAGFMPDLADDKEPVRHPLDRADLAGEALRLGTSWLAKVPAGRLRIQVVGGSRPYGTVLFGQRRRGPAPAFLEVLDAIAALVDPVVGFCHPLTERELEEAAADGRPDLRFASPERLLVPSIGFSIWQLAEHGLPALYWRMYFGSSLRALLGERLRRAPWARVRAVGSSGVLVADVTDEPPTSATYPDFRVRREAIMDTLGREWFWPNAGGMASLQGDGPLHRA